MANSKRTCAYKECRASYRPEEGIIHPCGKFGWCGPECRIKWAASNASKFKQKADKAISRRNREDKRKLRLDDVRHQKRLTQKECNKLCLLLDKWLPCISCGRPDEDASRKRNASHFKSRGASSGLQFDLRNLHAACVVCNLYQSGNLPGYKEGILERYGQKMLDYLESAPRSKEWTIDELETMRAEFAAESRRLKAGLGASRDWRSLPQQQGAAA